jgi:serine/threonine-protein kinase
LDARVRFRAEAEAVADLQHPNIVQVYEVGEHAGSPYFSMEYVPGGTLRARLDGQPRPARESAELVAALARAVQYAHDRGIVHRDLKPANVLLAADGTPKVADFGLAKRISDGLLTRTQTGWVLGTPSYMAPEQAAGKGGRAGPAADVYALGALFYELLTGRPPFAGETFESTLLLILNEDPVPPRRLHSAVPRDLETICLKCLQKDPHRRYPSAAALADDLRRFLAGEPIAARPVGGLERTLLWARRKPWLAGLAAAVVVLLVAGSVVSTYFGLAAHGRAKDAERALADARAAQAETDRVAAELLLDAGQGRPRRGTWAAGCTRSSRPSAAPRRTTPGCAAPSFGASPAGPSGCRPWPGTSGWTDPPSAAGSWGRTARSSSSRRTTAGSGATPTPGRRWVR